MGIGLNSTVESGLINSFNQMEVVRMVEKETVTLGLHVCIDRKIHRCLSLFAITDSTYVLMAGYFIEVI